MNRDKPAVEMPEVRIDPVKFALDDFGLDDDWQTLTHEDVRDLQKLFEFFVAQNPDTVDPADEEEDDDPTDDEDDAAALVGYPNSSSLNNPSATQSSGALSDGNAAFSASGPVPGAVAAASKPKRPRVFSTRGAARLLQALGLFLPFRDVQRMLNDTKRYIDHGRPAGALDAGLTSASSSGGPGGDPASADGGFYIPASDVRGLTYDDFVMLYALASKELSTDREVREAFRFLDDDFDGFVEVPKLVAVLGPLLGLDAPRTQALLLKARAPAAAGKLAQTGHGAARAQAAQSALSPQDWLQTGKMSYAEFVEFLSM